MNMSILRIISRFVLVLLLGAFWFVSRRPSYVEIEGHVYERLDPIQAVPVAPVSGARVSNDWDSTSTTTDHLTNRILPGSGVFDLGSPRVMEFGLKFTF